MNYRCLSAHECRWSQDVGVCKPCRDAQDAYAERSFREAIKAAERLLRSNGYRVVAPGGYEPS
jgi:hypothetical protein